MTLLKALQETNISGIDGILQGRKISLSARKLIETGVLLNSSADPVQRNHGLEFLTVAVKELEPSEEPASPEAPGLKSKGDHFVKEETLDNHNNGQRNEGSEQSSDNTEPYPKEGKTESNSDIEGMESATGENQMKEGMPMPPGMGMPGMGMGMMPGMEPGIAQEMGKHMGQIPNMTTPQQMQQMQYMLSNYHKRFVAPMNKTITAQRETIIKLSKQIQETQFANGNKKLDLGEMRNRVNAFNGIKETTAPVTGPQGAPGQTPQYTEYDRNIARHDISEMNKRMNDSSYIQ